jgi:hypothetical protein
MKRRENEESKNKDKKIVVIKFKILNLTGKKKKISLLKSLDLFLWHQIQVLRLSQCPHPFSRLIFWAM